MIDLHRDEIQKIRDKQEEGIELTPEEKRAISGDGKSGENEDKKQEPDGTQTTYDTGDAPVDNKPESKGQNVHKGSKKK